MSRVSQRSSSQFPLLPLKNVVIFPRNVVTLQVGRSRSMQAVEDAVARDRRLVVTAYRDPEADDPAPGDLHEIGTLAHVASVEPQAGGSLQVVLEGLNRVRLVQFDLLRSTSAVAVEVCREPEPPPGESRVLIDMVQDLVDRFGDARNPLPAEVLKMVREAEDPGHLADLLATQLLQDVVRRQALLELLDPIARIEHIVVHLSGEIDAASIERRVKERVREQIDRNQREYYLREQLKAIHDELGGEGGNEIDALRRRVEERGLPPAAEEKMLKEVARLERMPGVSAEATVVRTYIDTVLALPWGEESADRIDIAEAERILDEDHHGLEPVKERIIEFLAVRKLTAERGGRTPAQILCLAGPPGVGKTSLGRSVARAMGRPFVRVSLGGVRDESEIRGHRRTYIGAMPGRLVSAMKQAGVVNPVILLDEIDKMASDYRGDPASALLEVLDPEQNAAFTDHFLDLPYDLSRVLFITTANYLAQVPRPLRDRMEIIELSGYAEEEKIEIGRKHLLPRQIAANGLEDGAVEIVPESWVRVVRHYTREAGVRQLDRELQAICRKIAGQVVRGEAGPQRITESRLADLLGPARYDNDLSLGGDHVGLAIGLGVTEAGGELLPVEVLAMPGKGGITITGKAGEVMQESARAALSFARSRAAELRIDPDFQGKLDLHLHLPEGATPKDGPSAGITMAAALISALTRRPVRGDTAMTGEITLRGRVIAIGGLKEKALAAHRAGVARVIAPRDNERDYAKLPQTLKKGVEFIWVSSMDEVIAATILADGSPVDGLLPAAAPPLAGDPGQDAGKAVPDAVVPTFLPG
ncbi:MAG: endopeptidase La, partial [Chloroflexota bacterium]